MARKSGFVRRHGVMRRETLWLEMAATSSTLPGATSASRILTLTAGALALRPFTIIRTVFNWHLQSDQFAVSELQQAAIGGAVVTEQASAIGITAIPTPFTDLDSDAWYFHSILTSQFLFATAIGFESPAGVWKDVESKGQRKVEGGFDVNVMIETSSVSVGSIVSMAGRFLVKLH